MMGNLLIHDLTEGEKMAFLTCLFLSGDMTSNEYVREVRMVIPGDEPIHAIIERATDWECVNRMLGKHVDVTRSWLS